MIQTDSFLRRKEAVSIKKKAGLLALSGVILYALLLLLLLQSERACPDANIRTFSDALWYSLVTLTTVGYGDLYPVSPIGRAIASFFLFLSAGLLASLLVFLFSILKEQLLPRLQLSYLRRKPCYLFSELNPLSLALAENLTASGHREAFLFCGADPETADVSLPHAFRVPQELRTLAPSFSHPGSAAFLVSRNAAENYALAAQLPLPVYCRGSEVAGLHAHFFDEASCAARTYWQTFPLRHSEQVLCILGNGKLAEAVLESALQVTCRLPFVPTCIHLFGDWTAFCRLHAAVLTAFSDREEEDKDALCFHPEDWRSHLPLLASADRILLCDDAEEVNAETASLLSRFCAVSGTVYAAASIPPVLGISFGGLAGALTAENVLQDTLDARAKLLHDLYCRRTGTQMSWESLSPFLKASNRAAADSLATKLALLLPEAQEVTPEACSRAYALWQASGRDAFRRNEHERWSRFYRYYNWQYGPEKNEQARTHPCLVPYDSLSPAEKEKDDSAWEQLDLLAEAKEERAV